jgi:hypothetical protein
MSSNGLRDLITLGQQQLGEISAILARNTADQCFFHNKFR